MKSAVLAGILASLLAGCAVAGSGAPSTASQQAACEQQRGGGVWRPALGFCDVQGGGGGAGGM